TPPICPTTPVPSSTATTRGGCCPGSPSRWSHGSLPARGEDMLTSVPRADRTARDTAKVAGIGAAGVIGSGLTAALARARIATTGLTRTSRLFTPDGLSSPLREARTIYYLASSINPMLGEQHPELATADHKLFATLLARLARVDYPPTVVLT